MGLWLGEAAEFLPGFHLGRPEDLENVSRVSAEFLFSPGRCGVLRGEGIPDLLERGALLDRWPVRGIPTACGRL